MKTRKNLEGLDFSTLLAREHLLRTLAMLAEHLFTGCNYRFSVDKFPFTHPSYEMEVEYEGKWMEVLGCGVVHPKIMEKLWTSR